MEMKQEVGLWTTAAITVIGLTALLTACDTGKISEPFHDAQRGSTNSQPMDVIEMSDGFSNVGTKCDHGNRIYVVFKSDAAYGSVAVVSGDPTCKGR